MQVRALMKNRRVWMVLAALLLALLIYFSSRPTPPLVIVSSVKRGDIRQEISDFGTTLFKDVTTVLAPYHGWITKIETQIGQTVLRGQSALFAMSSGAAPLLDPRTRATLTAQWESARSQTEQARAQLLRLKAAHKSAQAELQRNERVYKAGAVSLQDIEHLRTKARDIAGELRAMEATYDAALHQRDAAKAAMSSVGEGRPEAQLIVAPNSGIISWIYDEKARFVTTGTPILDIASPGQLSFQIDLLARDAMSIRNGLPVWFSDFQPKARVRNISPTALPKISPLGISEQRIRVWIDFNEPLPLDLPAGLELEAHIETARSSNTLFIPKTAVWTEENRSFVFIEEKNVLQKKPVVRGIESRDDIEIKDGLKEGDWVVQLPTEDMKPGQKIAPQRGAQ